MTPHAFCSLYRPGARTVAPNDIFVHLDELGLADGIAFAMLMTRSAFHLARVEDKRTVAMRINGKYLDDARVALTDCYEIRLFGPETDARWQRTGADGGRLTILTVRAPVGDGAAQPIGTETLCRHYRLFGKADVPDNDPSGWSKLKATRVAPIAVPLAVAKDVPIQLDAVEHIARLAHGNAAVIAERLTGFSPIPAKGKSDEQ